ncbi:MAG: hypothetical protein ACM3N9_02350 [Syntrophothermus sp.]
MKKIILVLLIIVFYHVSVAQHVEIGITTGYSTFAMSDLKTDLENAAPSAPFDAVLTNNFPGYLSFGGFMVEHFGFYGIGITYQYNSTGARVTSSDYSGRYNFDESLRCNSIGLRNNFLLDKFGNCGIGATLDAGVNFTKMKIEETLVLNNSTVHDQTMNLESTSFFLHPGLFADYLIFPFLKAGINAGYQIDFKGMLKIEELESGLKSDWSGFRLQVSLSFVPAGLIKE